MATKKIIVKREFVNRMSRDRANAHGTIMVDSDDVTFPERASINFKTWGRTKAECRTAHKETMRLIGLYRKYLDFAEHNAAAVFAEDLKNCDR